MINYQNDEIGWNPVGETGFGQVSRNIVVSELFVFKGAVAWKEQLSRLVLLSDKPVLVRFVAVFLSIFGHVGTASIRCNCGLPASGAAGLQALRSSFRAAQLCTLSGRCDNTSHSAPRSIKCSCEQFIVASSVVPSADTALIRAWEFVKAELIRLQCPLICGL